MGGFDLLDAHTAHEQELMMHTPPAVCRGKVVPPAPTAAENPLWVSLDGWPDSHPYQIPTGQWAFGGPPDSGAACVVLFDHLGDAWVPLWLGEKIAGAGGTTLQVIDGGTPSSTVDAVDGGPV
jgi:hypothetical protein